LRARDYTTFNPFEPLPFSVTRDTRGFGSLDREGAPPFVHDSEQFNGVLIDTLKELKTDPVVKCRDRLVGIELKSWQEETLLQPADLIAYENFKVAERKYAGAEMRLTMKKILDTEFRGRNAWLQKDPLQEWRDKANKETLNRLFVPARMKPLS